MNRAVAVAVWLALPLAGSAFAAPASLEVDSHSDPAQCAKSLAVPCPITYTSGATPHLGDDEVRVDGGLEEVRVAASVPLAGSHQIELDPSELVMQHPVFTLANRTWQSANASRPEATQSLAAFESRPGRYYSKSTGSWYDADWGIFLVVYPPMQIPGYPNGITTFRLTWNLFLEGSYLQSNETTLRPFPEDFVAADRDGLDWPAFYLRVLASCQLHFYAQGACPYLEAVGNPLVTAASTWEAATPTVIIVLRVNRTVVRVSPAHASGPPVPSEIDRAATAFASNVTAARIRPAPMQQTSVWLSAWPIAHTSLVDRGEASTAKEGSAPMLRGTAARNGAAWTYTPAILATATVLTLLVAILYHRIARQRALDQMTRQNIVDLLQAEPGLRMGTIARRLKLDYTTVRHHTRLLTEFGLISAIGDGQKRYHVTGSSQPIDAARGGVLEAPAARGVLNVVLKEGRLPQGRLVERLGLPHSTVSQAVDRLQRAGLVVAHRERGHVWLELPAPPEAATGR